MDGFTIFWIIFMGVICVLRYKFPHLRRANRNKSMHVSQPTQQYNWMHDLSKSDQIGNMYHNNNNH